MEKAKFIFRIETEFHLSMLTRICSIFSRSRIHIEELQVNMVSGQQRFVIIVHDRKENAIKLSKKIEGQVDVLSVNLFEQTSLLNNF